MSIGLLSSRRLLVGVVVAMATLTFNRVSADVFFVAQNATGASDSNDGSAPVNGGGATGPWLTLTHAAQVAGAGDTVFVYSGDYRDEVTGYGSGVIPIEQSGTFFAPIRFVAAAGETPILNTLIIHEKQWIEVSGFTFESPDFTLPPEWRDMPDIVIDNAAAIVDTDQPWEQRETYVRLRFATYMGMQDFFTEFYTNGLDIRASSNITVRGNSISLYTFGVQVRGPSSSNILIEDNFIHHCLDGIFTWQPAPSMVNSVIRGNVIRQSFNNGMQIREDASGILIEDNDIRYSGTAHITVISGVENSTVRANHAEFGGYYSETMQYPGSSAINVHSSRGGIIVERNYAAHQVDLTYGDGNGYIADLMLDDSGILYRNNIAYRNMGSGLRMVETPNCVVVNNTFVQNGWNQVDPRDGAGIQLSRESDVGTVIVNNLFYDNLTAGIRSEETIHLQERIDHNLYGSGSLAASLWDRRESAAPLIWDAYEFGVRSWHSIDEIMMETGWESGGLFADPGLRSLAARDGFWPDYTGVDFRLLADSPAIGTGVPLPVVFDDFGGESRPAGERVDIGAWSAP